MKIFHDEIDVSTIKLFLKNLQPYISARISIVYKYECAMFRILAWIYCLILLFIKVNALAGCRIRNPAKRVLLKNESIMLRRILSNNIVLAESPS